MPKMDFRELFLEKQQRIFHKKRPLKKEAFL
jgi:hypothetical protein